LGGVVERATDALVRGRDAFSARAWQDARTLLATADADSGLAAADLEVLATAAYMLGREEEFERVLERAYAAHLETGEARRAARCAIWVGISLALRGEVGPASGWFGRAGRTVEGEGDCVEHGYLFVPRMMQQESAGDYEAAESTAADAAAIAERFADADLLALAMHTQGRVRIRRGAVDQGLALLDEAMVAVVAGELSPIVTGLVYCSVIEGCQEISELRRVQQWTDALTRWCDAQPDLVSFTGKCLMHRSEMMQLRGAWSEALEESARARARFDEAGNTRATAQCLYVEGEVHRLRGDFDRAESAYRTASQYGRQPQPGLALLRLAQGDDEVAASAIRRVVGEVADPVVRSRLVPAHVEIALAVGDIEEARAACSTLSVGEETELVRAMRFHAQGAVDVAASDAWAALVALRQAVELYEELDVPYEVARARVLVALACRALGDDDAAALELTAARVAFAGLGAEPDVARVDALSGSVRSGESHGLTPRELEVLRLVAAGETNRGIATTLVISERTVARHVSNIFTKLRLSTRSAATAYAYEHELV
jgi:ATP/maltotriose-dependent transcriptional regulator MalT